MQQISSIIKESRKLADFPLENTELWFMSNGSGLLWLEVSSLSENWCDLKMDENWFNFKQSVFIITLRLTLKCWVWKSRKQCREGFISWCSCCHWPRTGNSEGFFNVYFFNNFLGHWRRIAYCASNSSSQCPLLTSHTKALISALSKGQMQCGRGLIQQYLHYYQNWAENNRRHLNICFLNCFLGHTMWPSVD